MSSPGLPRVVFVCLGNACRSQMAEGFARTYGKDVMAVQSAGLAPAMAVPLETVETMSEKNIDIAGQFPKALSTLPASSFDLLINMSGYEITNFPVMRTWKVHDPIGAGRATYRAVRDQIELLVMQLIVELRRKQK
ncbi:MAG: hypothetical protein ABIZ80_12300 [Bryobacteraceae bacterium]